MGHAGAQDVLPRNALAQGCLRATAEEKQPMDPYKQQQSKGVVCWPASGNLALGKCPLHPEASDWVQACARALSWVIQTHVPVTVHGAPSAVSQTLLPPLLPPNHTPCSQWHLGAPSRPPTSLSPASSSSPNASEGFPQLGQRPPNPCPAHSEGPACTSHLPQSERPCPGCLLGPRGQ